MNDLDLVVVLATSQRPDLLERTLASLGRCRLPASFRETIVVENGPKAGVEEVIQCSDPCLKARYLYVSQGNKSVALNHALQELDHCLVFFTDDDIYIARDTLAHYVEAARRTGRGTFFGGPTGVDYERQPPLWLHEFLPSSAKGWSLGNVCRRVKKPIFLGFNWAAFSEDLKELGPFNFRNGPGSPTQSVGQESDMMHRMLARGFRGEYVPEAMVWHRVPLTRCSPEWALDRAYRRGVSRGMRRGTTLRQHLSWYAWGACRLLTSFLWVARGKLSENPVCQFKCRFHVQWAQGFLQGCRIAASAGPRKSFKTS